MSSQGDNKVSQLETPYVHKFSVDQQKRQVHIRRCQRIMLVFLVIFIILGIQIFQSKRTLAKVNGNIAQYQASLQSCMIRNMRSRLPGLSTTTRRRAKLSII